MRRIIEYCIKQKMFEEGDRVLLGLSGGADSVCMFYALLKLRAALHLHLLAVHVHHGIRGEEADRDALFSRRLCEQFHVEYHEERVNVTRMAGTEGLTVEEAGRKARYQCFFRLMEEQGFRKLAVAHHRNDLAETMLFHMARGTGLSGLAAMKPVTELGERCFSDAFLQSEAGGFHREGAKLVRPLLGVTRNEIEDILNEQGISYCTDTTNGDTAYTRNYIRCELIPRLEQVNPKAVTHMAGLSERLALAGDYLEEMAKKGYETCVREEAAGGDVVLHIDKKQLSSLHACLQQEVLKYAITRLAGYKRDIQAVHVEELLALSDKQSGRQQKLPYGMTAWNGYGELILERPLKNRTEGYPLALELPGQGERKTYVLPEGHLLVLELSEKCNIEIGKKRYTKYFDCGKIKDRLVIRYPEPGDYFVMNQSGNKKSLRRYFIDEKIPAFRRKTLPVMAEGSHVAWVPGYRISEYYKITEDTEKVLKLSVLAADGALLRED